MDVYKIHYGTSGFRFTIDNPDILKLWHPNSIIEKREDLPPLIIYRCGISLAIIANSDIDACNLKNKFIGTVITASHNPQKDNGIKIFGSDGYLISEFWENELEKLVNCTTDLQQYLQDNSKKFNIKENKYISERIILIGRDNRESGSDIVKILISGIQYGEKIFGKVKCVDMGIVCTATLAWCVRFSKVDQDEYYKNLSNNWDLLLKNLNYSHLNNNIERDKLVIDGAQGSFSAKIEFLKNTLIKLGVNTTFYHCNQLLPINDKCGSDYVMSKGLPCEILNEINLLRGYKCVSFDGDADRLIYYIADDLPRIANGDYILCLIVKYLANVLSNYSSCLSIGVAQTQYSNISSTNFILDIFNKLPKNIKCQHMYTDCGVKHLKRAIKGFDIAIYYEPNGHGELILNKDNVPKELLYLSNLSNIAMGDSISNCLIVEACLLILNTNIREWLNFYTPIPSLLSQMPLDNKYRNIFTKELPYIVKKGNDIFSTYPQSRFHIRLSGTESCIRVFVESINCVQLSKKLEDLIKQTISQFD